MLYLTGQMRPVGLAYDDLLMIPRRQSNYTVLISNMKVKGSDIPDWISCPPTVSKTSPGIQQCQAQGLVFCP